MDCLGSFLFSATIIRIGSNNPVGNVLGRKFCSGFSFKKLKTLFIKLNDIALFPIFMGKGLLVRVVAFGKKAPGVHEVVGVKGAFDAVHHGPFDGGFAGFVFGGFEATDTVFGGDGTA